MDIYTDGLANEDFGHSGTSTDGFESSRRMLNHGHGPGLFSLVWKSEGGTFVNESQPYAETLVVLEGKGEASINGADPVPLAFGSVVHMPFGASLTLKVIEPLRYYCFVTTTPPEAAA